MAAGIRRPATAAKGADAVRLARAAEVARLPPPNLPHLGEERTVLLATTVETSEVEPLPQMGEAGWGADLTINA
jgi:hypothetical protein